MSTGRRTRRRLRSSARQTPSEPDGNDRRDRGLPQPGVRLGSSARGIRLAESRGRTVLQQPDQEEDDHDHEQRSRTDVHVVSFLLSQPSHQSRSNAAATIATIVQMTRATPPSSTNGVPEPRPRTTDSSVVSGGDEASDTTSSGSHVVRGRGLVARRHGAVSTQPTAARNERTFVGPSRREPTSMAIDRNGVGAESSVHSRTTRQLARRLENDRRFARSRAERFPRLRLVPAPVSSRRSP